MLCTSLLLIEGPESAKLLICHIIKRNTYIGRMNFNILTYLAPSLSAEISKRTPSSKAINTKQAG